MIRPQSDTTFPWLFEQAACALAPPQWWYPTPPNNAPSSRSTPDARSPVKRTVRLCTAGFGGASGQ